MKKDKNKIEKVYNLEVENIKFKIERKRIKNIYIKIKKDKEEVIISSPLSSTDKEIINLIYNKLSWIKKHYKKRIKNENNFLEENKIIFFGKIYEIQIIKNKNKFSYKIYDNKIEFYIHSNIEDIRIYLDKFYKNELEKYICFLKIKYENLTNIKVNEIKIRKMKTRWGSCNVLKRKIWLNFSLVYKQIECLEAVFVHEISHLIEKSHNKNFYNIVNSFYPNYKNIEKLLKE